MIDRDDQLCKIHFEDLDYYFILQKTKYKNATLDREEENAEYLCSYELMNWIH